MVIWTGFVLVSRFGTKQALLATDLAALRFGVSGAVMLPVLLWRLSRHGWSVASGGLSMAQWLSIILSAGVLFGVFAFAGFLQAPAAHGSVLTTGTLPFWTALLAWLFLRERPSGAQARGLVLIAVGVALIGLETLGVFHSGAATGKANLSVGLGDLCFFAASISWAAFLLLGRRWKPAPLDTTIAVSVGSALIYLPIYFAVLPRAIASVPLNEVLLIGAWQGLFSVVLNMLLYTRVLTTFGPIRTAMLTTIVPGLAALLAVPVLDEPLSVWNLVGLVVVTAGMVIGVRR